MDIEILRGFFWVVFLGQDLELRKSLLMAVQMVYLRAKLRSFQG